MASDWESGDRSVVDSSDSSVVESGDISAVESGDSSAVESSDSFVVESGDSSAVTRWTVDQEVVGSNPTHGGNLISVVRSLSGFI